MLNQPTHKVGVPERQRVLIYCQHVLGMGHLIRSMAIARALKNCEVLFVNGGEALSEIEIPSWVTVANMPPISSDGEFEKLNLSTSQTTLEEVQQARRAQLLDCFDRHRPDVVIIELFPFGRKRFAFELLPLLAHIRLSGYQTKIVCSLRDILVKKSDQVRHEDWVVSLMNRYFDLLLIHSDPTFQTLDETFSRCHDLRCEVQYTGFVTQHSDEPAGLPAMDSDPACDGLPLVLVSAGGGRVGFELLDSAVQASSRLMERRRHRMLVFTGPYMPAQQFEQLQRLAVQQQHIEIRRFTPSFRSIMGQATLSISMAGYNTCMDLLKTGTRALALPFTGHGNEEQTIRAKKLEQSGLLTLLEPADLLPDRLAAKIEASLALPPMNHRHSINTDGGRETALAIEGLASKSDVCSSMRNEEPAWLSDLRQFLASRQAQGQDLHLFLRDDDVDEDEETLKHLLDIALARRVPMNLEIVPGRLTAAAIAVLKNTLRADPSLLSLDQHGWIHANHEIEGRKCEFGPSRSLAQQTEDIARGKALLESTFEDRFYPAFTPPWNRCTKDTYRALDELGFLVLSKDRGKEPITGYRFKDISTTLDLYTWKEGARMKAPNEIVQSLISQMEELPVVGLLLHHKVMDAEAFEFLDQVLREFTRHSVARFHTFQTLLPLTEESRLVPR